MKWLLYTLVILLTVYGATALNFCEDSGILKDGNCSIVTPPIECGGANGYEIYNETGTQIETGTLTPLLGSTYYLNFTQPAGTYIIKLCDGSTKTIFNTGDDDTMMWIIIILPIIIGLALMYWGSQLPEDSPLRLLFQLFLIPLFWIAIHFAVIAIGKFYPNMTELIELLGSLTYYLGWVFLIIGLYLLYKLLMGIKDMILQKKSEKEAEKYD